MNTHSVDKKSTSQSRPIPSLQTLVWRSLTAFRALHLALALGVAAATAVIVGALVVGDSVRGSLQDIIINRLGNAHSAILSQKFFSDKLVSRQTIAPPEGYRLTPAIVMPASAVELIVEKGFCRAANVQVLGVKPEFWKLISSDQRLKGINLGPDEVALSAELARELDAKVGDQLTIRLPKGSGVPADSPLGRRDEAAGSLPRQRVVAILPADTAADIDFRASQQPARNLFVSLVNLQEALDQFQRVNAALLLADDHLPALNQQSLGQAQRVCDQLNAYLKPQLSDYGLKLTRHRRVFPDTTLGEKVEGTGADPKTIFDYYQITSDQLIIDNLTLSVLMHELQMPAHRLTPVRVLSYLINEVRVINANTSESSKSVTYSIVAGLEDWETALPITEAAGQMWQERAGACGVNRWLADQLNLKPGNTIRLKYFEPETVEGREIETSVDLNVGAIVDNTAPEKGYTRTRAAIFKDPPTKANDPDLTPIVPGITDQDTISDWDLPFKLTRTIPKEDDDYWRDYRLTPKIFLRYSQAVRNFGSRFGNATAIRLDANEVDAAGIDEAELSELVASAMLRAKAGLGMQLLPIRAMQLKAASGTTPFDGLFLALSFFVIVSALMLVALLFRLSIEQRSSQWGILLATGFDRSRVRELLLAESTWILLLGIALGCLGGLGYAWLMIAGLESWWVGAISGSFLNYYFTTKSLLIGGAIGGLTSLLTIWWSLRRLRQSTPLGLLRGQWDTLRMSSDATAKTAMALAGFLLFGALGLLALGFTLSGMAQAGTFFGCGMLTVCGALCGIVFWLKSPESPTVDTTKTPQLSTKSNTPHFSTGLWSLAWSALRRNLWRSVLTLGLLAVASFLIGSMSVFQIAPSLQGSGGFELIAESSLPIYRDPGTVVNREEALSTDNFNTLRTVNILSFRERPGEDASCNNLFQVAQPTILGVPTSLLQHQLSLSEAKRFQWAAAGSENDTPWHALAQVSNGTEADPIPVVIDMNTAAWSLHQGASVGAITKIQMDDRVIYFRTVGLLSNSIMQGKLLISEYNFAQLFPEISGYRYFLIHDEQKDPTSIIDAMENGWSDQGLDVTLSADVLTKLLAVQNTYISAFQAIGALGLLLGTIGLAIVQVRSVIERRRELALMRAIGFSPTRLASLLMAESTLLLLGGLMIGIGAAALSLVPYTISSHSATSISQPLIMLAIILVVGLASSLISVLVALRQPLLKNLA